MQKGFKTIRLGLMKNMKKKNGDVMIKLNVKLMLHGYHDVT